MKKLVELKNISFGYDKKNTIFSQLNIQINKGDFIGIFGENGSGKTTLVKLLLSILSPNNGEILWYGDKGEIMPKKKFKIEYISQKAQMIDSIIPITVREIVKMGDKISERLGKNGKMELRKTIENALKHVHMIDFIYSPFSNLSNGQKQRVLIAKALISNPDVIIMDEPTAGVDLMAQKHFYDLLGHLNEVHNITIVLISHDLEFIQEKIKRLWYVGKKDCEECSNEKIHLGNIKKIFPHHQVEFIS